MTLPLHRLIVGYGSLLAVAVVRLISDEQWPAVCGMLTPDPDDPDFIYSYKLDLATARKILALIGEKHKRGLEYFLETER